MSAVPEDIIRQIVVDPDTAIALRCTCKYYSNYWNYNIGSRFKIRFNMDVTDARVGSLTVADSDDAVITIDWNTDFGLKMYVLWKIARAYTLCGPHELAPYDTSSMPGRVVTMPPLPLQLGLVVPEITPIVMDDDDYAIITITCPPCERPPIKSKKYLDMSDPNGLMTVIYDYYARDVMEYCATKMAALEQF